MLRVTGQQTEDKSETEGAVFYDIRFNALAPADGHPIRLIINVEAQNDFHPGYPLLKRAIYYCSRLISSQYGSVFVKSHYEKIQKVYSIWICTAPTKNWSYTITRYRLQEENIVGQAKAAREDYDLLTPILVCLGSEHYTELTGLLRMLNLVLIDSVDSTERLRTLENEFDVKVTPHLEKGSQKCVISAKALKEEVLTVALPLAKREVLPSAKRGVLPLAKKIKLLRWPAICSTVKNTLWLKSPIFPACL